MTASSRPVVSLHQQVRCGQQLLEDLGCLSDLLGSFFAMEVRKMPSITHARPRTVSDSCLFVCGVPSSGLWHVSSIVSFLSWQILATAGGVAYAGSPITFFGGARSPPHRTFCAAVGNTRAASALMCALSATRRSRSRQVEAAVASGHCAKMDTPRAHDGGYAHPNDLGPGQTKPDEARPKERGSRERAATGGARS